MSIQSKLSEWLGLIRFSHTIFALPFAILAAFLAWATPLSVSSNATPAIRMTDVIGVLMCMVFARSAAMAFNRLVDHKMDAENPRTASRHLPAGRLSRRGVLIFTVTCSLGFIASTLLFLPNRLPFYGSIPVLAFLLGYSLAKRFTASAHLWLGVALSLSPLCVWVAIRGPHFSWEFVHIPLLLAGAIAFWVAGFDILYACQDAEFDRAAGLHSVPSRFGVAGAMRIAMVMHVIMLGFLAALVYTGHAAGLGWLFAAAVGLTAILVMVQHWLVRPDDLSRVNAAFFQTNAIISIVLLMAGAIDTFI
ncbi:UbiA-like polyprenyltransferase [Allorhodopirellula heiligendammensis]|uniref:4-hydroxybenzoate polyprenyltransferase n=1 Tax=Allorhodopirellula heiligendammensis TaxID=2714739 RepID=A0A5C6BVB6_9BACT|nr:UbiA-like polyprenyltransferase [Allorhodopirellula heiligendammensis]TWU15381.1 4-hydroxybenzoate octaprenyltransferase [Allorhodopirellula heiligendammensis]